MKLHELKEKRAALVTEMRSMLTAADKRSLTADEQTKFDGLKTQITDVEGQEARAEFLEAAERRSMGQAGAEHRDAANLESRIDVTEAIRVQIEGRSLSGALAEYNQEQKRLGVEARGILVPSSIFEKRVQTTANAAAIKPEDFAPSEYVGLLRNSMVVQRLGARVLPNLRGDLVIPKAASSHTAYWVAEGEALTPSDAGFVGIKLQPRHVGALTELSRQLIQQSNPAIEQLVRDDFAAIVALAVDKAVLHGDALKQPRGLLNRTGANGAVQTALLGAPDWNSWHEILEKLALANVTPNGVLTHPAVDTVLRTARKHADDPLSGYLLEGATLTGLPVLSTNQLDAKSAVLGRLLVGDFSQVLIGQWGQGIDILANPYAESAYAKGNVQIRIFATMDVQVRNEAAFVLVDNVVI